MNREADDVRAAIAAKLGQLSFLFLQLTAQQAGLEAQMERLSRGLLDRRTCQPCNGTGLKRDQAEPDSRTPSYSTCPDCGGLTRQEWLHYFTSRSSP